MFLRLPDDVVADWAEDTEYDERTGALSIKGEPEMEPELAPEDIADAPEDFEDSEDL